MKLAKIFFSLYPIHFCRANSIRLDCPCLPNKMQLQRKWADATLSFWLDVCKWSNGLYCDNANHTKRKTFISDKTWQVAGGN